MAEAQAKPRLMEHYEAAVRPQLMEQFGLTNQFAVPKIDKIVLNMGVGEGSRDGKILVAAAEEMTAIAGQKPVITHAKQSIAAFKLREGMAVGCKVTLRGKRMYEFLDRLITIALPRMRDFRGVSSRSFDGRGNYSLGIREQIVFPEIDYDQVSEIRGMDVVICTTARDDEQGKALLAGFEMPFRN